ncbi:helix-turn-helix domain-containing protein [Marinicellulosiphila megalodicopiae]|uniref:helix-turn-helix domain-containing protein n=1 Tax=Marinicellulosiphila megalodicopiae TaxID=2724896 RepID=UPI003BB1679D
MYKEMNALQFKHTFVQNLKKLCDQSSVSQVARQTGIGESTLRKYLNGSEPTLSKFEQIVKHTGHSIIWWLQSNQTVDQLWGSIDQDIWEKSEGFTLLYFEDIKQVHPQFGVGRILFTVYHLLSSGWQIEDLLGLFKVKQ